MSQGAVIGDGFYNSTADTFDATTPMISLTYNLEPTDSMPNGMIYALYSEGFLTGGFNAEINSNLPAVAQFLSYDPEEVNNYELGFKGTLAGGNVQLATNVFYMDYKNQQQSVDIANPDFAFGADDPIGLTQNVASSAIYGLEFELRSAPWEGGYLSLDVGYLKNEYDEYNYTDPGNPGQVVDLSNVLIHDYTPDWTVNLALDHEFELASGATITPRANVYWQSNYDFGADTGSWPSDGPSSSCNQESYAKLDARLTYIPAEGDWQVAAYGGNLTDERYLEFCDTARAVWRTRLGRPRFFGLEFMMHFGRS
jgi:iron complex outermembrane receptor protein